jgi:hypothetical protein
MKVSHVLFQAYRTPRASPGRYDQGVRSEEGKYPMKPLQVDDKAMSVGEPEDRSGWSMRVASTARDRRLKGCVPRFQIPRRRASICAQYHF